MSKVDQRIQQIKTQLVGNTGVRVLLLEGPDDVDAFRILLDRQFSDWEKSWHLESAGGKKAVLGMLDKERTWRGVVDRDEWTVQVIAAKLAGLPNLSVLPRFCLESYLVDPAELWAAFPAKQQAKILGGLPQLEQEIEAGLAGWIRQAALWHEVRPLWARLRGLGFPEAVLNSPPMPDDNALTKLFKDWHDALDATTVLAQVKTREQQLSTIQKPQLYAEWLYAKAFYPEVVHPVLNRLLGQKDSRDRRNSIFRTRSLPADMQPIWQAMGLMP
jgi:hypothetical protein